MPRAAKTASSTKQTTQHVAPKTSKKSAASTRAPRKKNAPEPVKVAPEVSAREAGLRYVHDDAPGISRRKSGTGFSYRDADGEIVRDAKTLARIKALAIPPAYRDVWICPRENGHIQATGMDERGRKQYRYHAKWREVRDQTKYSRMMAFGRALPAIRERAAADSKKSGLSRERVLGTIVQLLEKTLIRVGNEEYSRTNGSYGLTTMKNRHVEVEGKHVTFSFKGKSGVRHTIDLHDAHLAPSTRAHQRFAGTERLPISRRKRRAPCGRFERSQRVSQRNQRRRLYRERFSHLGWNCSGVAGVAGMRKVRQPDTGEKERGARHRTRR